MRLKINLLKYFTLRDYKKKNQKNEAPRIIDSYNFKQFMHTYESYERCSFVMDSWIT